MLLIIRSLEIQYFNDAIQFRRMKRKKHKYAQRTCCGQSSTIRPKKTAALHMDFDLDLTQKIFKFANSTVEKVSMHFQNEEHEILLS